MKIISLFKKKISLVFFSLVFFSFLLSCLNGLYENADNKACVHNGFKYKETEVMKECKNCDHFIGTVYEYCRGGDAG